MKGLVVVTHSSLALTFLQTAEMILGTTKNAEAVCIERVDSVDSMNLKITQAIERAGKDGEGVVIMTDMFGGTPSNISMAYLERDSVEVLTGVNLPMILSFFNLNQKLSLPELVIALKKAGTEGIVLPSALLAG